MQFIEHTVFGVRSAVRTFEKRGSAARFVLVPMIHLASPEFFAAVHQRLSECDVVVAEGVAGLRSRIMMLEEYEATEDIADAFVVARDRGLCTEVVRLAGDHGSQTRTIGVCWGATHMRAVTETLHNQLGYRVVDARWLSVF